MNLLSVMGALILEFELLERGEIGNYWKHYEFGLEKVMEWNGKPEIIHLNVTWPLGKIARLMSKN